MNKVKPKKKKGNKNGHMRRGYGIQDSSSPQLRGSREVQALSIIGRTNERASFGKI
jgi:hypothetical protein